MIMKEIIYIDESSFEYDPKVGYLNITCELPFICERDTLYVENPNPDDEKFTVLNIASPSNDTLEVHLNSDDWIVVKSDLDINKYLFKEIIGNFRYFNEYCNKDDKFKFVFKKNDLESFDLYRDDDNGDLVFSISLFKEKETYYLIVFEPDKPWKRDKVSDFQFSGKQLTCHLENGDTFNSKIICVPYIEDIINNISELLR
ncbi:hypothetical protein [Neisseria zoodegmatis]|nr:hypothetical protein [Neisseria zoodegmatis]SNU80263.1 Uncharacterised protein [Neisseria zoodegmatis]